MGTSLGTILVVDDVATVLAVTRRLLERLGWSVITASTGEEAIAACRGANDLSAMLLDGTLVDLSGEETLARVRAIAPLLPVVIMTGDDAEEASSRFETHGIAGVVQKPFRPHSIASLLAPYQRPCAAVG